MILLGGFKAQKGRGIGWLFLEVAMSGVRRYDLPIQSEVQYEPCCFGECE